MTDGSAARRPHVDAARRRLLAGLGAAGAAGLLDTTPLLARLAAQARCAGDTPLGTLVGTLPLYGGRGPVDVPYGPILGGQGLDARRLTDLSRLDPDHLVTPTPDVFIRTTAPAAAARPRPWSIDVTGSVGSGTRLTADDLAARARPQGVHLIECAGNSDPQHFGLMSAVEWTGVPLATLVDAAGPASGATGVLVRGVDDDTTTSRRSQPGASWVLPLEHVARRGAFLATGMNGQPLPSDHGAPVRLVVPGWYGCAWIKWVDQLAIVGPDAPATVQMQEFAARTHQDGIPALARDYTPPAIDLAAMPVRVEKRLLDGRLFYRLVGIVWGGEQPVNRLGIRFGPGEAPQPITVCPPRETTATWALWEHHWRPTRPGVYNIALQADDPAVRTRRLDLSFYVRRVRIDEPVV